MKDGILHWKRKCLEAGAQGTANRVILAPSRGVSVMASGYSFTDALHPREKCVAYVVNVLQSLPPLGTQLPQRPGFQLRDAHFFLSGPCFPPLH